MARQGVCASGVRPTLSTSSVALLALLLVAAALPAATVLFDNETAAEVQAWHYEGRAPGSGVRELTRVERFASSGRAALCFRSPAWKQGMPSWPAFEAKPTVTDWSGHDRLVYDLTNATAFPQRLNLFIADEGTATRSGLHQASVLAAHSYSQVVVPLAGLAEKKVKPQAMRVLHFYTAEPPGDLELYLDRVVLLRPGEPLPEVSESYRKDFGQLQLARVAAVREQLTAAREQLGRPGGSRRVSAWVAAELAALGQRVDAYEAQARQGDPALLQGQAAVQAIQGALERLRSLVAFRTAFESVREAVRATRDDLGVGVATSMEKVLPRALAVAARPAAGLELDLARNETESCQIVVVPFERDLAAVQVRIGDLRGEAGATFAAATIQAVPVGYVETKAIPPYGSEHVGWWPDPILNFLSAVPVAKGDAQAFWVRCKAPRDQAPGLYRGAAEVLVDDQVAATLPLAVTVHRFTLPDRSPLPLAVTFSPHDHPTAESTARQAEWRKSPDYPINAWKRHTKAWASFLADYYLTYDSLYHRTVPDFEILAELHRQGRLDRFNLGYYGPLNEGAEAEAKWRESTLPRLRSGYDKAKELGLLDHAYIYGCDEAPQELFPTVQRAAAVLKAEFPGVLVMTTTYDHSFGQDSPITAMDAWCPLTPKMQPELADRARAAGREVWWYICCGPHHPHANMFIEYPAIEGRVLMGPLTAKYRPDGFLYYQISIWNSERPIESGPFTTWDPRSWTSYHGDGSWTCVGPDGTPLPTMRLENFRDGLEDYAYHRILAATAAKVAADPALRAPRADWLARAQALLRVPEEVVKSTTEYTRDPAVMARYRAQLVATIEAAGIAPVEPWEAPGR